MKNLINLAFETNVYQSNKKDNFTLHLLFPLSLEFETPDETHEELKQWIVKELEPSRIFESFLRVHDSKTHGFVDWSLFRIHFTSNEDVAGWAKKHDFDYFG